MTNTEMLIRAMTSGGSGGGVKLVDFNTTFAEVTQALNAGNRVSFGDDIAIETPLAPEGYVNLYMEINGASYIDFTPMGGAEQISFHTIYDATDNPLLGKLMSISVRCYENDIWHSKVTFIDSAT